MLSSAEAREIEKNLRGLLSYPPCKKYAEEILAGNRYQRIEKSRYTDDKKISDHYALIPTGQGLRELSALSPISRRIYDLIMRRFLSIFYPPAVYDRLSLRIECAGESFLANSRSLRETGYLGILGDGEEKEREGKESGEGKAFGEELRKGQKLLLRSLTLKEGETSPPKRYSSGSMILAMENAGNLIEDEELRAQIRGSGIGTSATRAAILTKLERIGYLKLQKKTQLLFPTELGELVTAALRASIRQLLNPELTASWEKGLSYVAEGRITEEEYMAKLDRFVRSKTNAVKAMRL